MGAQQPAISSGPYKSSRPWPSFTSNDRLHGGARCTALPTFSEDDDPFAQLHGKSAVGGGVLGLGVLGQGGPLGLGVLSDGESEALQSGINSSSIERCVLSAARRLLFPHESYQAFFEHGHWWVRSKRTGATWSVEDATGPGSYDGFTFEKVDDGNDD